MNENLNELRRSLAGTVLGPADADYDAARRCFNALVDRRPAVIARCLGADDVATAFDFARSRELEVAVRGGGHNPAGHCVSDGGLVIDLSLMRTVEVDSDARIAHADGGTTWLDFDSATQAFGLVTPGGVIGSTGVCGLTLGGGIGHLTAQHGLTCDNLVGGELVTPDGAVVRVGPDENADLLWGLRGGGGNFGVATRLAFRLHPVARVVGGLLVYEGEGVRQALCRFRDVAAGAPRELSCQAVLAVNESLSPALVVAPCYTGSDPDPEELLDELIRRIAALGRPPGEVLIESLHGAPKHADASAAAVGFRDAAFNVSVMATWQDAALDEQHIEWARETAAAIEPWSSSGGGYVNYMQADEPIERVRAGFGAEAFERLRALKTKHDPDNVLRRNQNIPPQTHQ